MTKLRSDHNVLPLLGINKWEGEEGCYAYVKAYMIMNDLYVVRVRYLREGSACYFSREADENGYVWNWEWYTDLSGGMKDLEEDGICNHCTDEVVKYAKENGLIPEEWDWEDDRDQYLASLSEEERVAYFQESEKNIASYREHYRQELDAIIAKYKSGGYDDPVLLSS
jgi:hypothetical protein